MEGMTRAMGSTSLRAPIVLLLIGAAGLSSCASTEYGPIGGNRFYGYADKPTADGGFRVDIIAPAGFGAKGAMNWFHQRAEELCPAGVEKTNIFEAEKYRSASSGYNAPYDLFTMEGYVYCEAGEEEADSPVAETSATAD